MLVHCSAGVGRSGVFVLMDLLMAKVDCGDVSYKSYNSMQPSRVIVFFFQEIDVAKSLQLLRDQRMNLVQMVGQYKFLYSAIVHYIKRARLI